MAVETQAVRHGSEAAGDHRLLTVVAGPCYGKTHLLRTALPAASHWYDEDAVRALAAATTPSLPGGDPVPWLVLDDLPTLDRAAALALRDWLAGVPEQVGVALTSRRPLPPVACPWPQPRVRRVGPAWLALGVADVAGVLRDDHDVHDPELPPLLWEATAGWPTLVRLGAPVLATWSQRREPMTLSAVVSALARPGGAPHAYVLDVVLPGLPASARRLLREVATLDPVTVELCRDLGCPAAARAVALLAATGLLQPDGGTGERHRIVPVVAAVGAGQRRARPAVAATAAGWYRRNGPPLAAARAYLEAGQLEAGARMLTAAGEEILAGGDAASFVALAGSLPAGLHTWRLRLLWADALRATATCAPPRFEVRVDGHGVPASAWQSRKARDLVRILVARRGRSVPREELCELLWPEEEGTSHRLSVLLSIVRTVLDPRKSTVEPVLLADRAAVALDPVAVRVDVDDFLADVAHGCGLYRQGDETTARALLEAALASYSGDPFADEPYADWAAAVREQARWAYLRARRTLAGIARHGGDTDEVVGHLLAILERDPYDAPAHRMLGQAYTDAGRHGEAGRAAKRYRAAMAVVAAPAADAAAMSAIPAPRSDLDSPL